MLLVMPDARASKRLKVVLIPQTQQIYYYRPAMQYTSANRPIEKYHVIYRPTEHPHVWHKCLHVYTSVRDFVSSAYRRNESVVIIAYCYTTRIYEIPLLKTVVQFVQAEAETRLSNYIV